MVFFGMSVNFVAFFCAIFFTFSRSGERRGISGKLTVSTRDATTVGFDGIIFVATSLVTGTLSFVDTIEEFNSFPKMWLFDLNEVHDVEGSDNGDGGGNEEGGGGGARVKDTDETGETDGRYGECECVCVPVDIEADTFNCCVINDELACT